MHCCNFKACTKNNSPNHPNHKHENNRHFSYWPNLVLFPNFWLESQCDKYTFPLCYSSKERMHYPDPFCTFQPLHFPLMCTIKTNRCTSQNLFGFCTDAQQTHTHIPTQCNHSLTYKKHTQTHTPPTCEYTHTHILTASICRTHVKQQVHSHEYLWISSTRAPYMSPSSSTSRRSPLKWEYYHSRRLSLPVLRWNLKVYVCVRRCVRLHSRLCKSLSILLTMQGNHCVHARVRGCHKNIERNIPRKTRDSMWTCMWAFLELCEKSRSGKRAIWGGGYWLVTLDCEWVDREQNSLRSSLLSETTGI